MHLAGEHRQPAGGQLPSRCAARRTVVGVQRLSRSGEQHLSIVKADALVGPQQGDAQSDAGSVARVQVDRTCITHTHTYRLVLRTREEMDGA